MEQNEIKMQDLRQKPEKQKKKMKQSWRILDKNLRKGKRKNKTKLEDFRQKPEKEKLK